jgi:hypothetical protein
MKVEFNAEFLERRMAEHKRQMHALENQLIEEIIDGVQALPARAPKRSGYLFEPLTMAASAERVQ